MEEIDREDGHDRFEGVAEAGLSAGFSAENGGQSLEKAGFLGLRPLTVPALLWNPAR